MCQACDVRTASRRTFLSITAGGVLAGTVPGLARAASGPATTLTADQALSRLREGNDRYIRQPQLCAAEMAQRRSSIAQHQAPWATLVSCADSRVPPELLFGGVGMGELFVARNAGNTVDTATMGTVEYGSGALGVPLIVVLGHERCGAVAAACEIVEKNTRFPGSIDAMARVIVPAAQATRSLPGDWVENTVRESARRTAAKIATESPVISALVRSGKVKVVAGRYDLDDGKVEFLG